MSNIIRLTACLLAVALALPASIPTARAGGVKVENAWLRATLPGQKVAGGFMDITADRDLTLVEASSPLAETVEFHSMAIEDGHMRMRALKSIALPRGRTVGLRPGGLHVMLIGLKAPILAGRPVPVHLIFDDGRGGKTSKTVNLRASPRLD